MFGDWIVREDRSRQGLPELDEQGLPELVVDDAVAVPSPFPQRLSLLLRRERPADRLLQLVVSGCGRR